MSVRSPPCGGAAGADVGAADSGVRALPFRRLRCLLQVVVCDYGTAPLLFSPPPLLPLLQRRLQDCVPLLCLLHSGKNKQEHT